MKRQREKRCLLSFTKSEHKLVLAWMRRHGEKKLATAIRMRVMREAMMDNLRWEGKAPAESWTYAPTPTTPVALKPPTCPLCGQPLTFIASTLKVTPQTKRGAIPVMTTTVTHAKPVCADFSKLLAYYTETTRTLPLPTPKQAVRS